VLLAASLHAAPFDKAKLAQVDAVIEEAVAQKRIPGGVLWIEHERDVYHRAYGNRARVPQIEPMTKDTIFDAASITKAVATAPSIFFLVQRGGISLDAPVRNYLPEIADGEITVRHLLTHTSGLRSGLDLSTDWSGYTEGIKRALAETPRNRPGAVFRYSDINYILLGEIVQRVSGMRLDVFARENIFKPLRMKDTTFLPMHPQRVAPVEVTNTRAEVHDPTSRRMGGITGHAGMFTTAEDLARFARAVLRGRFFPPEMTRISSPPSVAIRRAGGFDIDSAYSRPRGEHFPIGESFGHTGWTGGFFWIDPTRSAFYVFLSNRLHPDGTGSVIALQRRLGTAVAEAMRPARAFTPQQPRVRFVIPSSTGGGDAQNGIDALHANDYKELRNKRIGLITNQTGIDRTGNPTVDLLRSAPRVNLIALFSPEHGIRGAADEKVADSIDRASGLPVYSLYGERRKPSLEQLRNLDMLVFDIQDIGTRFYTYISTMGLAMEAAAEARIKFVVLDRVNPIGEGVEGPLLEGETNFTAFHSLPIRHGMTAGELARMFREERNIDVDLIVIAVKDWTRDQWQDEAGLPWINTSPNMRSLNAAGLYPGIGILERAVSVGRGTDTPFEILGAPYIDAAKLVQELRDLPGVSFTPVTFTPAASVHKGETCNGVRIAITDRKALRSVDVGVAIASALARLYPDKFPVDELQPLLRHKPTLELIRAGKPIEEIRAAWNTDAFRQRRAKYLMY
jgi:uncharacterized protein YbbC (DUF1343 family)/CubicO group peptidase (beta-lactamase class C family)